MERQGRWLCSQVDLPHVECKDPEPQPLGDSKERQQDEESREEEAGRGPARSQVSSPSIATSSANRQLMMLEGKSGPYFSSLDLSIDILKKRAQDLIENINESRQKDHALMTNFRDSLKIKVSDLTEKLEERMYQIYNHHNKIIQEKLQEFTQKMAKISHLETELKQVCHTVETVYKDLCIQPEVRDINSCMGPPPEEGELWRLRRKQMSTQTKSVSTVPSPKPHRGHCHCKNPSDALAVSLVAPGSPLRWCV